ncbi:MAG TPA: hypothetical protein VGR96_11240 [Acidobacteriaceae bacterium]|nr:hypothetical protein [Acidobacteriaceae bacterium]
MSYQKPINQQRFDRPIEAETHPKEERAAPAKKQGKRGTKPVKGKAQPATANGPK